MPHLSLAVYDMLCGPPSFEDGKFNGPIAIKVILDGKFICPIAIKMT
jgi:hypothetical protein